MARTTFVEGKTQLVICDIVTPARILMRSFPSNAAVSPSSLNIECANCGLQLSVKKKGGGGRDRLSGFPYHHAE
jgi:hypothetical protein